MNIQPDISATKALYADNTGWCDCVYCRNYSLTLAKCHPEAVRALEKLGLRHDRSLEIMEYGPDDTGKNRVYEAYYPVIGTLQEDTTVFEQGVSLRLYRSDSQKITYPTPKTDKPYFMAVLSVTLPWVLIE